MLKLREIKLNTWKWDNIIPNLLEKKNITNVENIAFDSIILICVTFVLFMSKGSSLSRSEIEELATQ